MACNNNSPWFNDWLTAARIGQETFGITFTIDGVSYKGVRSDLTETDPLIAGGFTQDYQMSIEVVTSDIDPAIGTVVTIGGTPLRIAKKVPDTEGPTTVWYMQGKDR